MADSLVKGAPDKAGIIQLWREIRTWSDAHYPGHVLMAEWSDPKYCLASGMHVDMYINRTTKTNRLMYFDRKHQANGGAYFTLNGCEPSVKDHYPVLFKLDYR